MPSPVRRNYASDRRLDGREITALALMISFPVIGLDLFLRTTSGKFSAQPYVQVGHWLSDSLVMLPLFVAGVWAGDRIACRAGLGTDRRADVLKRGLLISLLAAVTQIPAWFVVNRSDDPATAQPLVPPFAHDSGDVYWVAPWVVIALVCVCLAPAAIWAARTISRNAAAIGRGAVLVLLLAATPALAWALHQAAVRAYASQVYYTSAASVVERHAAPRTAAARAARRPAGPSVTAAPFAVGYQAAHALQDGLAGQAAGLPVVVIGLLRVTRGLDDRKQHHPSDTKGDAE